MIKQGQAAKRVTCFSPTGTSIEVNPVGIDLFFKALKNRERQLHCEKE